MRACVRAQSDQSSRPRLITGLPKQRMPRSEYVYADTGLDMCRLYMVKDGFFNDTVGMIYFAKIKMSFTQTSIKFFIYNLNLIIFITVRSRLINTCDLFTQKEITSQTD